jgi:hypothetical protein
MAVKPASSLTLAASHAQLCRELRQLLPPALTPVAATVPEYMPAATLQHSSWMGGAVLSKVLVYSPVFSAACARTGSTYVISSWEQVSM